jgi:glycosyltransferase involved in cell wall biosynthesis
LDYGKIHLEVIKMTKIPLISVIIPIFNSGKYISSCLNSVINQTFKNIEIICIDDGSKDKSLKIVENYSKLDERIIIISQKNKGSGIARNKGIKKSKGKYIAFMDSDDLYPNKFTLELLLTKAIENKAIICGGGLKYLIDENNRTKISESELYFQKEGMINYNEYQYDFGYYRFIYKNNFIKKKKIYFPHYSRYQDPPFFIKAMFFSKKFYALKNITYLYRISHKKIIWNEKKLMDELNGFKDCFIFSEKYKLNQLYCKIIEHLNSPLFLTPIQLFYNNSKIMNKVLQILKSINCDKINKCPFKLNEIYNEIIKL